MSGRRLLLAAVAICPLLTQNAHANDLAIGLLGGVIGGIVGGMQQQQRVQQQQIQQQQQFQQQRMQQQQIQQQQQFQQQLLLQQQARQVEAERQRAAAVEARQRSEIARRQATAKAAAEKAAADKANATADNAPIAAAPARVVSSVAPAQPAPAAPAPTTAQAVNATVVITTLTNDAAEARGQIAMFNAIINEQRKMAADDGALSDVAEQSILVLEARVKDLQSRFLDDTTQLGRYRTSIKPNDPDLQITARKASEIYPKVPFYIPGTQETGEFLIEPFVTDNGELAFNLKFIDPKSESQKVRTSILLSNLDVEKVQKALVNVVKWAKVAHDKHIRRDYTQSAACFPEANCPTEDGQKRDGVASTEVLFKTYENGSTAGRIQRNKGRFEEGFNISTESASMLQAYFNHVLTEGKADFEAGSRTDDQMRRLFKPST